MALPLSITHTTTVSPATEGGDIYAPFSDGSIGVPQIVVIAFAIVLAIYLLRGRT